MTYSVYRRILIYIDKAIEEAATNRNLNLTTNAPGAHKVAMWNSQSSPDFCQPAHVSTRDQIITAIHDQYVTNLPSDGEFLDGMKLVAAFSSTDELSENEYLRMGIAAMKRAGRRDLAAELNDYYMQIVKDGE